MTEAYYFRQLDKAGQAAYHAMKTGLAALRPAFPVPRLEGRELGDVLALLRLDCPELFYVTGFSYRVHPAAATVELLPQYLFDKGKIQTHQKALAARLDRLCRPAMGLNEGEKERYVHDFICRNVRYDKLKKPCLLYTSLQISSRLTSVGRTVLNFCQPSLGATSLRDTKEG